MSIDCPVCGEAASTLQCSSCGCDLSLLVQTRRAAYRLAKEANLLARDQRLSLAADRAEDAMQLYLDGKLRRFFGWLLFLDGRMTHARRCWSAVPDRALAVIGTYNEALHAAQGSFWSQALQKLQDIDLPFRPALLLQLVCADRAGSVRDGRHTRDLISRCFPDVELPPEPDEREDQPETPIGSSWPAGPVVAAALMFMLAGTGLGYILGQPDTSDSASTAPAPDEDVSAAPVAEGPSDGTRADSELPDSLTFGWAYLQSQEQVLAGAVDGVVGADPLEAVRAVREQERRRIARSWYLRGLDLVESGESQDAVGPLTAAVASVGSASDIYWVDDAIYLLIRTQAEVKPEVASDWARTLLVHHDTSMFANSLTRSLAADIRKGTP